MSEFSRMPKAWHDSLDASLPPIYPIDFMAGSLASRVTRRMVHCLRQSSPLNKWEFCKREGIKLATLNSAIHGCEVLIWEDGGEVGLL